MKIFSKEELLSFNELMLGRGVPVTDDGIGYNKADYGACATYFYGLSDAQFADLAKRLVKYTQTQLNIDKAEMKETAKYYAEIADGGNRSDGVSVEIRENGTLISFRYNELFIETIKKQPKRQWDAETKNWIIPHANVIQALNSLKEVGADVENAITYLKSNPVFTDATTKVNKTIIECFTEEAYTWVKFKYDTQIVAKIKELSYRKFNPENKSWKIETKALDVLQNNLKDCKFEFKS